MYVVLNRIQNRNRYFLHAHFQARLQTYTVALSMHSQITVITLIICTICGGYYAAQSAFDLVYGGSKEEVRG